jgi:hypothetical protein
MHNSWRRAGCLESCVKGYSYDSGSHKETHKDVQGKDEAVEVASNNRAALRRIGDVSTFCFQVRSKIVPKLFSVPGEINLELMDIHDWFSFAGRSRSASLETVCASPEAISNHIK